MADPTERNKNQQEAQSSSPLHAEPDAAGEAPSYDHSSHHAQSWFQQLKDWSPSLVLENTGSAIEFNVLVVLEAFRPFVGAETVYTPSHLPTTRDHLASERTWLAYIRTSLAISSAGVALVQLFTIAASRSPTTGDRLGATIQKWARPIGATIVLVGLGVCILGFVRYFIIQHALTRGKFPTARLEVHAVSVLLALATGITFGVLCAVPR